MNIDQEIESQRLEEVYEVLVGRIAEVLGEGILELDLTRCERLLVDVINTAISSAEALGQNIEDAALNVQHGGRAAEIFRLARLGEQYERDVTYRTRLSHAYDKGNYEAAYTVVFDPGTKDPDLVLQYTLGYYSSFEVHEILVPEHRELVERHRRRCDNCGAYSAD